MFTFHIWVYAHLYLIGNCLQAKHFHCAQFLSIVTSLTSLSGLPGSSAVKNPPAMQEPQEMWVWSLGWEYPLEEGMATHSIILQPGESLQRSLEGYIPRGWQKVQHNWSYLAHLHTDLLSKTTTIILLPTLCEHQIQVS